MFRVDFEKTGSRPQLAYEKLIQQVREAIPFCSVVVLSDYAKGALDDDVCKVIIDISRTLGLPVFVDPKSSTFEKYRNATTVCPNLQELAVAAHDSERDIEKLLDIGEQLVTQYKLDS
jgi:D-beta-D-heptose 7-phosphate kinase / D-beta-D-heptose 1-phosphate adenosyltransferase